MPASDTKSNSKLKSQITIDLLRTLATAEAPEEAAHKALVTIWRLMGLRNGAVYLSEAGLLRCVASTGRFGEHKNLTLAQNAYPAQRFGVFKADQGEVDFLLPSGKHPIHELVSVPILSSRRELLGVIVVGYEAALEPDETQINQLSLVCTAVASALERIYGYQKLQSELAEKQTLLRLSALLEGNTDEHIRLALEEIRILAGADVAAITLLEGDTYRARLWLGEASPQLVQGFASGMQRKQVQHLHALLGRDYQALAEQDHPLAETLHQFGIQAIQVINMPTDLQFEGLVLYRLKQCKGWSEAEVRLLRSASQTLGAVITRVSRAKRLEARNQELEIVATVSRALNKVDSVQEAAECLAEQIAHLTEAAQTTVNQVAPDGESVQNVAVYGLPGWVPGGVPRGQGLTWMALEQRQPVFTQDAQHDPRGYFPTSTDWPRSILYVPMFDAANQPLGTLGLSHPQAGAICEEDIRTLGIIASVAANALQRLAYKQRLEAELRAKEILLELSHLAESDQAGSLEKALERVQGLAQADLVILGDYDQENIRIQRFVGEPIFPVQVGEQILQKQLRAIGIELRERLHIVDTRQAVGFSALSTLGVGSVYLTTAALEPGIERGLGFFRREMRPWGELERRVMDGAARMIGAMLKRSQTA